MELYSIYLFLQSMFKLSRIYSLKLLSHQFFRFFPRYIYHFLTEILIYFNSIYKDLNPKHSKRSMIEAIKIMIYDDINLKLV